MAERQELERTISRYNDAWNSHDLDAIVSMHAPGMVFENHTAGESATGDDVAAQLTPMIAQGWSLATAFSLLAWYVFAPQCISTLAIVRRETNSMRYPLIMAGYLFALAYLASFVTYRVALHLVGP